MSLVVKPLPVPLRTDTHGVLRAGNTRVPVDTVIIAWKQGNSPEQIVESFDTLKLADVYTIIGYYLNHRTEVEEYLEENRLAAERLREETERRFPPEGIRERLLARRQKKGT